MHLNYRNPVYLENGCIDCEVDHPDYGWIPFTANPQDEEQHGRDLHARMELEGGVAPYIPPTTEEQLQQWRMTASCSPLQGQLALGEARWLQVEAALEDPTLPWAMKHSLKNAVFWSRISQDSDTLAWILGLTDLELDDVFKVAIQTQI